MFLVYILYSTKLNRYYIGHSNDIDKRLLQHNRGISSFTSKAQDWVVKYTEEYSGRKEAYRRELEIKAKKSRKYIEWLISPAG